MRNDEFLRFQTVCVPVLMCIVFMLGATLVQDIWPICKVLSNAQVIPANISVHNLLTPQ